MYDTVLLRVEKASILRVSLENTPTLASLSLVELDEGGNPGETLVGEVKDSGGSHKPKLTGFFCRSRLL